MVSSPSSWIILAWALTERIPVGEDGWGPGRDADGALDSSALACGDSIWKIEWDGFTESLLI